MPRGLLVWVIGGFVWLGSATLHAQRIYTLKICNEGPGRISMAYLAERGIGFFSEILGAAPMVATGWFEVMPNECRDFNFDALEQSRSMWLGFTAQNSRGDWVSLNTNPRLGARLKSANTYLCVDGDNPFERFGEMRVVQQCPAGARNPIDVPLTATLTIPEFTTGGLTFTMTSTQYGKILTPRDEPAIVPPRPAPKPFQAGTATATFLDKTIARWREGDGQWFYDNGSAVQGIKDGPHHNLGLFDWPRVYTTLPDDIGALLNSLESPELRKLGVRENIRLREDGRLYISSGDETAWRTTSLQSLDAERATYSSGFVRIPCREGYQNCVYENFSGMEDNLRHYVGIDQDASRTVIAGFRALKALFGDPTRVVREDADCSCLRYDVGVAVAQPDIPSRPRASEAPATSGFDVAAVAGSIEPNVNAGKRATDAVRDTSAAGWYTTLIILAFGVLWALRSRVKSGSST
jgi:hypothetical protein